MTAGQDGPQPFHQELLDVPHRTPGMAIGCRKKNVGGQGTRHPPEQRGKIEVQIGQGVNGHHPAQSVRDHDQCAFERGGEPEKLLFDRWT